MSVDDPRPAVCIGHVLMDTHRMQASAEFLRAVGMRVVFEGEAVSILELRGGTHLILRVAAEPWSGAAPFDLMVDDLHATHARFVALGLNPSAVESRPDIDHQTFTVTEPGGNTIVFFSSHVTGPV